jgi:hypothetical protein
MTAKVAIRVETIAEALQVPIQAVVERGRKHYCLLVRGGSALEARQVLLGSTNEKFLVIRDGLSHDDVVLMNPRVHLTSVNLPEVDVAERPATPAPVPAPKRAETEAPARAQASTSGPGS